MKTACYISTSHDTDYKKFEELISHRISSHKGPLFSTDATGLFEFYLEGIIPEARCHYNCYTCRNMIEKYGNLVTIDEVTGYHHPLLWYTPSIFGVPDFFIRSFAGMGYIVDKAKVTGVFLSSDKVWGKPVTGVWTHLSGTNPNIFWHPLLSANQMMSEKQQDYGMLCHALSDFPIEAAIQAVRVLEADAMDRSEKTLGVAQWFLKLHQTIKDVKGNHRSNLIWLTVAQAPPGWCHIRSTMISTLLDDIILGLPFEEIKRKWDAKMHPLQYQRPTAPPSHGLIKQANEVVTKLNSQRSLQRRFAKIQDILFSYWVPQKEDIDTQIPQMKGPFDHLLPQDFSKIKEVELPIKKMTWDKFKEEVLPQTIKMDLLVPAHGGFFGMVTAHDDDAPPILQWDGLQEDIYNDGAVIGKLPFPRNPVSWYFYHQESYCSNWNLDPVWTKVNLITNKPCYWQDPDKFSHHGTGVFFILQDCWDKKHKAGGSFFPETLKSEYHSIRGAMEAYSNKAEILGKEEGTANGICLDQGGSVKVKVKTKDGSQEYQLSLT